jgi:predicted dithiol-disulfide oxidoreductase (DUF899 family)
MWHSHNTSTERRGQVCVFTAGAGRLLSVDCSRSFGTSCDRRHGGGRYCAGCSSFTDNVGNLAHLHTRDTSLVLVSDGPLTEIVPFQTRMGWTVPWYSVQESAFSADSGVADGGFALSIFLRDGDRVFRTYFTRGRGVDRLRFDFNVLDLTPLGRQETWEDSPAGWPQTPPYRWWRLHDEYADHT